MEIARFSEKQIWILSQTDAVARRCSVKKGALKKFAKFTGKHLCRGILFKKRFCTGILRNFEEKCFYRTSPLTASE